MAGCRSSTSWSLLRTGLEPSTGAGCQSSNVQPQDELVKVSDQAPSPCPPPTLLFHDRPPEPLCGLPQHPGRSEPADWESLASWTQHLLTCHSALILAEGRVPRMAAWWLVAGVRVGSARCRHDHYSSLTLISRLSWFQPLIHVNYLNGLGCDSLAVHSHSGGARGGKWHCFQTLWLSQN